MAQLLCIGDLHLGRWPSRLPAALLGPGSVCSPEGALKRAVETALERRPDGVLLAGDVVERSDDRFAAWNALARAVERLLAAGIPVLGVTGNHDVEALPRLADRLPEFRLLGRGGHFESVDLPARDGRAVRVWGWSFPAAHHTASPLPGLAPARAAAGAFAGLEVGLLHCDLDQPRSPYAPVARRELEASGLAAWFLGHVHQPSLAPTRPGGPWIGYLGSLVGLDPGESGRRGPWWIAAGPGELLRAEHLPEAPLRYERVVLDLTDLPRSAGADSADHLHAFLDRALQQALAQALASQPGLRGLAVRAELVGALPDRARIWEQINSWRERDELPSRESGAALAFFEQFEDRTQLALDLPALSGDPGPVGALARRLMALESGSGSSELEARLGPRLEAQLARYPYLEIGLALPTEQRRAALTRACRAALEAAFQQIGGAPA